MKLYKDLTEEETTEFKEWVETDEKCKAFIRYTRCFHPVVKKEIAKRIFEDTPKLKMDFMVKRNGFTDDISGTIVQILEENQLIHNPQVCDDRCEHCKAIRVIRRGLSECIIE